MFLGLDNTSYLNATLTQHFGRPYDLGQLQRFMNELTVKYPNMHGLSPQQYTQNLNQVVLQSLVSAAQAGTAPTVPGMPGTVMGGNPGGMMGQGQGQGHQNPGEDMSPNAQVLARRVEEMRRERNYSGGGGGPAPNPNGPTMMQPQNTRGVYGNANGNGGMYDANGQPQNFYQGPPIGGIVGASPQTSQQLHPQDSSSLNASSQNNGKMALLNPAGNTPISPPVSTGLRPASNWSGVPPEPVSGVLPHIGGTRNPTGERLLTLDFATDLVDQERGQYRLVFPTVHGVTRLELVALSFRTLHPNIERGGYFYSTLQSNAGHHNQGCVGGLMSAGEGLLATSRHFFTKLVPHGESGNSNRWYEYRPATGPAAISFQPPVDLWSLTWGLYDSLGHPLELRPFHYRALTRLNQSQLQITTYHPHGLREGDALLITQRGVATRSRVLQVTTPDTFLFTHQADSITELQVGALPLAGHLTLRVY